MAPSRRPKPEKEAIRFAVPRLAVKTSDGLLPFDKTHFLDDPWKLEECDAVPELDYFASQKPRQEEAYLDVSKSGQVKVKFVKYLHEQLRLALADKGWNRPALINWLDRRFPRSARQDTTRLFRHFRKRSAKPVE